MTHSRATVQHKRGTVVTGFITLLLHFSVACAESVQSRGEPQDLPRYQSALLLVPLSSKDEDTFTDIRLNDPVYSARTEGEPNTFSFRTFLQVKLLLVHSVRRQISRGHILPEHLQGNAVSELSCEKGHSHEGWSKRSLFCSGIQTEVCGAAGRRGRYIALA